MRPKTLIAGIVTAAIGSAIAAAPGAFAAKPASGSTTCHKSCSTTPPPADTTAPSAAISSPAAGSTVSSTVTVSGTASDNAAVARVDVEVDGGSWQQASGTTSWTFTWNTTAVTDGTHSLVVRATDTSGNTGTASESVTVSNTTSGGGSTGGSTSAPNTQGSWVSPEGVHINVNTTGSWTINQIYSLVLANARDLSVLGPLYTINVQDTTASMTTIGYQTTNGVSSNFHATTYLKGNSTAFVSWPNYVFAHEFGEAWTQYYWVMKHGSSWASWEQMRFDQSTYNGTTYQYLSSDPRLGSTQTWDPREIIADDYRLLFASSAAISERPYGVNTTITDPRNQPGLDTFLLQQWA